MEIKAELFKPYTEEERLNFIIEYNHNQGFIIEETEEALRESILVIDANTGQNGLQQAKIFKECVNLTAVALTKLDGSAKGAIVLAIAKELGLSVKLVGVGEKMEDLKLFDSKEFVKALFNN